MARRRPMGYSRISRPLAFGKTPLPMSLSNTVKYVEPIDITLSGSGAGTYVFSCNGLYDPNITGTGHQPLYFDQYMALYRHYTVMKSNIKVTPYGNDEAAPGTSAILTVFIDDDATLPSTTAQREQISATNKVYNVFDDVGMSITKYWNGKRTYGGNLIDNRELSGNSGANPSEQSYFVISINKGGAVATHTLLVEIEYTVVWHEHVSVASS